MRSDSDSTTDDVGRPSIETVREAATAGGDGETEKTRADVVETDQIPAAVETFTLLSDETRVRILVALAEHPDRLRSFSDLRSHVGVTDSGQFNYHLDRLCERLVARTDDGYVLTDTGQAVARLL